MLYMTRMTRNKNISINALLQHGRVTNNKCCVVFPASRFSYLILCPDNANGRQLSLTYL